MPCVTNPRGGIVQVVEAAGGHTQFRQIQGGMFVGVRQLEMYMTGYLEVKEERVGGDMDSSGWGHGLSL